MMPAASISWAQAIVPAALHSAESSREPRAQPPGRDHSSQGLKPMPLALFRNRAFLVAVGLLLLALIIWFAGPYFALAR